MSNGNVLAGFGLDPVEELFLGHQRHAHPLHDHRMPRNRRGHVLRLDLLLVENRDDLFGDRGRVHDGAVHDRILRQEARGRSSPARSRLSTFFSSTAFTELEPISRPISDFVFPRLNIVRPLAPHSVPLRRAAPAFTFASLAFAFARKPRRLLRSAKPTTPFGSYPSAEHQSTATPGTLRFDSFIASAVTKCQATLLLACAFGKTSSERTGKAQKDR